MLRAAVKAIDPPPPSPERRLRDEFAANQRPECHFIPLIQLVSVSRFSETLLTIAQGIQGWHVSERLKYNIHI